MASCAITIGPMAKKVATTIYITEGQQQLLKELNRRTKVPTAEYIREGIDLILQKYRDQLPGQLELEELLPNLTFDEPSPRSTRRVPTRGSSK